MGFLIPSKELMWEHVHPPAQCRDAALLWEEMEMLGRAQLVQGEHIWKHGPKGELGLGSILPHHPWVPCPRVRLRHPPWH